MLLAGREVRIEKNCALVYVRKTLGTVFLNTDLPADK